MRQRDEVREERARKERRWKVGEEEVEDEDEDD